VQDLQTTWEDYYRQCSGDTVLRDQNFFRLELQALREALLQHAPKRSLTVVELGSGTGCLAEVLMAELREGERAGSRYVGVDFSTEATGKAMARDIPDASFVAQDFLSYLTSDSAPIDVLVVQRSLMALISWEQQRELLVAAKSRLAADGVMIMSEGTQSGFTALNDLREATGQPRMSDIWHCLYVDEEMIKDVFDTVSITEFCSTYWLLTRVIYPYKREAEHNTPIHDLAAKLPQIGEYGLVKMIVAR
jgi:hypothetical protein